MITYPILLVKSRLQAMGGGEEGHVRRTPPPPQRTHVSTSLVRGIISVTRSSRLSCPALSCRVPSSATYEWCLTVPSIVYRHNIFERLREVFGQTRPLISTVSKKRNAFIFLFFIFFPIITSVKPQSSHSREPDTSSLDSRRDRGKISAFYWSCTASNKQVKAQSRCENTPPLGTDAPPWPRASRPTRA